MELVELTDAELDAVAAGAPGGQGTGAGIGGLVGAGIGVGDVSILDNNKVTVQNLLNGNEVGIGVAAAILGVAASTLRQ